MRMAKALSFVRGRQAMLQVGGVHQLGGHISSSSLLFAVQLLLERYPRDPSLCPLPCHVGNFRS
jgi:hypothetical protein